MIIRYELKFIEPSGLYVHFYSLQNNHKNTTINYHRA